MISRMLNSLFTYGPSQSAQKALFHMFLRPIPHFAKYVECVDGLNGLEIGGPSPVFKPGGLIPIYDLIGKLDNCNFSSRTIWEGQLATGKTFMFSQQKPPGTQYILEASNLSEISDGQYDFLLSSHMLEHSANPIKVLREWRRVLKPRGRIIILLPNKRWTFDHRRPITKMEHLIADFDAVIGEDDLTHLNEIMSLHDLKRDKPAGTYDMFKARSERNFENRCLQHHVFDASLVRQMLEYSGFVVQTIAEHLINIVAIAER